MSRVLGTPESGNHPASQVSTTCGSGWFERAMSRVLGTSEPRDHPTFMRIEKVSVRRANVNPGRRERAAAEHFLTDKPLVIVFIEFGFEAGIRRVI